MEDIPIDILMIFMKLLDDDLDLVKFSLVSRRMHHFFLNEDLWIYKLTNKYGMKLSNHGRTMVNTINHFEHYKWCKTVPSIDTSLFVLFENFSIFDTSLMWANSAIKEALMRAGPNLQISTFCKALDTTHSKLEIKTNYNDTENLDLHKEFNQFMELAIQVILTNDDNSNVAEMKKILKMLKQSDYH